jgi:hypothetical protein
LVPNTPTYFGGYKYKEKERVTPHSSQKNKLHALAPLTSFQNELHALVLSSFLKRAQQLCCICLKCVREKGELDIRLDNCKHEGSKGLKSMGN